MIIIIPRKMLLWKSHGQKWTFYHWQNHGRERFRCSGLHIEITLSYTKEHSEESWVTFFQMYLPQSVLAPLKCLTTNMLFQSVIWPVGKCWNWQKVIKGEKKQTKNKCFDSRTDKWAAAGSKKLKVANEVVCLNKIWRSRCASTLV